MLNYVDDWYGTAGIESWISDDVKYMLLVNDNANLKCIQQITPQFHTINKIQIANNSSYFISTNSNLNIEINY